MRDFFLDEYSSTGLHLTGYPLKFLLAEYEFHRNHRTIDEESRHPQRQQGSGNS